MENMNVTTTRAMDSSELSEVSMLEAIETVNPAEDTASLDKLANAFGGIGALVQQFARLDSEGWDSFVASVKLARKSEAPAANPHLKRFLALQPDGVSQLVVYFQGSQVPSAFVCVSRTAKRGQRSASDTSGGSESVIRNVGTGEEFTMSNRVGAANPEWVSRIVKITGTTLVK